MKRIFLSFFMLFTFSFLMNDSVIAQESYVVIVNSSSTVSSISKSDLANIFMKRKSSFAGGTAALPVDQLPEAAVREEFSKAVLNKNISAIKNYWSQQLFSGSSVPPEEMESDTAVISFVSSKAGGIGYVSSTVDLSGEAGVKVLTVE